MSDKAEEINRLEAEIQTLQNEIDRRHERIDAGVDAAHNQEKIDELRAERTKLTERLEKLRA